MRMYPLKSESLLCIDPEPHSWATQAVVSRSSSTKSELPSRMLPHLAPTYW
jgi:hypothetical protein